MNLKSGLRLSLVKYGTVVNYPGLSKNLRANVVIVDNSYFALGFGGNGITFSMVATEMIIFYGTNI